MGRVYKDDLAYICRWGEAKELAISLICISTCPSDPFWCCLLNAQHTLAPYDTRLWIDCPRDGIYTMNVGGVRIRVFTMKPVERVGGWMAEISKRASNSWRSSLVDDIALKHLRHSSNLFEMLGKLIHMDM